MNIPSLADKNRCVVIPVALSRQDENYNFEICCFRVGIILYIIISYMTVIIAGSHVARKPPHCII